MRINRVIGLLLFLLVAKFLLTGILASFSRASSAVFDTIEAAAIRAQKNME